MHCFACIEEKLEQNLLRKPLLLTLMTTPLTVQKFLFKFWKVRSPSGTVSFFLTDSVRQSVILASLMALQKQNKRTTRVGKAHGSLRIGSSLTDKVTKSYFDQICTCSRKRYISWEERGLTHVDH